MKNNNGIVQQERDVYACPHCENPNFIKFGKEKGTQRYRCKKCNKTFRATTGSSLHYMHKRILADKYIKTMRKGLSLRKAALEVGISLKTSFSWRHKFLSSLSLVKRTEKEDVINGKAVKIIKLPYSDKGRRKAPEKYTKQSVSLMIVGKDETTITRLSPSNQVKSALSILKDIHDKTLIAEIPDRILKPAIDRSGKPRLNTKTKVYKDLQKDVNIKTDGLMSWMERFQGVATKYLHHYWNWFSVIDNIKLYSKQESVFYDNCTKSLSRNDFFNVLKM